MAWLGLDAAAVAAGALIAAAAPLGALDDAARGLTLEALSDRAPSARVLLVVAAPEDLRAGECERSLRDLLERGGARGALLLAPADAFCGRDPPRAAQGAGEGPRGAAPPAVRLPPELLRMRAGEVIGFEAPDAAQGAAALRALGIAAAPWVLPKAPRSVPAVTLRELTDGRLPPSVLKDRIVLVASGTGPSGAERGAPARSPRAGNDAPAAERGAPAQSARAVNDVPAAERGAPAQKPRAVSKAPASKRGAPAQSPRAVNKAPAAEHDAPAQGPRAVSETLPAAERGAPAQGPRAVNDILAAERGAPAQSPRAVNDAPDVGPPRAAEGPAPADPAGPAASALQPAQSAAAALGGLLDQGRRAEAPRWVAPLLVLLAGLIVRAASRRSGQLAALIAVVALAALLIGGQALAAARLEQGLLPLASALLGLAVAAAGAGLTRSLRRRSAVVSAAELIERAALFKMQGVHALPDEEFWPRVARLAAQAHPADVVLVADLPPRDWHLRFWNDRQGGESLIAERRRDIRRVPFSNEEGVPTIHVARGFLSRQEMPAVVVPLIAFGEVEGYVFLCGDAAEATFTREPERAERLGRELALLVRRKRLGRVAEPDPAPAARGREPAEGLVEGSRIALGDLQLFGAMLRTAPVGLLYADAFGDVRFLSRELAAWLRELEVTVPPEGPSSALPPGSLTLGEVLEAAEEASSREGAAEGRPPTWLSSVMASEEGIEIPVEAPEKGVLHVRPLRQEADGLSWIAGYMAALVPAQRAAIAPKVRAIGGRDSVDPLSAFPLGEVVAEAVAAAAKATSRPLRLEPIRGAAHAIGHRAELGQALTALLVDVAERGLPGHGPVVSVRESTHGVQLSILDVGFGLGLPESALQRVLMAPTAAPPGLEPLGRMIVAVEDSHGEAELKTNDGWGITLVVTLLKAHPRLLAPAPDSGRAVAQNVVAIGRKQG